MDISLFEHDIKPKKEKFEMKNKGLNLLVATFVLICCIICSFALVACSKSDANGYVGTYYEYKNGQKTDFWIKLDKDAWSSSDEAGGRLEINGEEVTAYAKIFGEEDVFFTGTVKDGVLTYSMIRGMEYKAYKDGAYENGSTGNENNPNNPDTPNKETFTVTFNTVGGSSVSNATVSSGNTVAAPADPTKSGYNFVGWYSDSSYTNKWQFTTPVRSNITLYAKWEAQIAKYTVSFDSNGGSAVTSVQVNDGDKLTAPTQPVRKMYVFNGWYKDSGFTQVWDFDTDTVTKNITLYAKWKEEEVRITSVNNATIADNEITMVVSEGTDDVDMNGKVVLNNPNATWKLYYDKLGQMEIPTKLATNKNETLGEGSNLFYIVVTNANGTQTKNYVLDIYKKYEVKVAVYGLNGTTPIETLSAVTLETMPTPTATVTGYTIIGWDSTSVAPGKTLPKDSPRLINLTAKLKANTYKVTLDGKGGTLDETEYNAIFASAITLPVPAKEGYTFIGWYKGDEKVTNGKGQTTWTIAKDTALTAKYRANVYSVTADKNISAAGTVSASGNADSAVLTFDNNGRTGATEIDPQTVTYYYGMSVPTPPKADGYLFTGWYKEPACKTRFDFTKNIYCDTTAYAGWYYTGTSSTVRYMYEYSAEIQVTTSDDYQYIYFAPVTSGTYYLYYKNSTSSSTNAARMTVYNRTKNTNVKSETSVTNTSYTSVSFTANAGDIYYVRVGKYSSSSTFSCYLKPSATTSDKGYFRTPDNVASAGFQSRVSLRATTNNGYTFIGWYKGKEKVSSDLSMTITAPSENVVYTAKWYKLDLQLSDTKAGSVGGLTKAYKVGDSATITATTNAGYTFIGWYDGETKLTDELSYTFNMPSENKTYTAKWILCPVTLEKNIEEAGNVSGVEKTILGKETTITATTNIGYTWVGWYDGETKLTDELSYTFNMPSENKTYTAKWACYTLSTETNMSGAGTYTKKSEVKTTAGTEVTLTATTNDGYTWLGWYDGETKLTDELSYTFEMPSESKTYTAKWTCYTISTETNMSGAGTYTQKSEVKTTAGAEVTLKTTTNDGYTWLGWYEGETKITDELTYTFIMPNESKTYMAKYGQVYDEIIITKNTNGGTFTMTGDTTQGTLTAVTDLGYTWIGWYDGETKLTEELIYTFNFLDGVGKIYTAKWILCPVTLEKNIEEAGNVSGVEGATKVGEEVTITATTNDGYTFIGWYDGDTLVGVDLEYTFVMSAESKTYTAKWILCPVTIEKNIEEAGTVSGVEGTTKVGEEVTITSTTNAGYTWVGWYDGDSKVSEELTYTFIMSTEIKTYTAKFEKCTEHTPDDNCVCTKCGAVDIIAVGKALKSKAYIRHNNDIYFGSYPQTKVTDNNITATLNNMAGTLPTSSNSANWTAYYYYTDGSQRDFMWYIDKEYNGEKYRGVYFTEYRPHNRGYSGARYSYQDDNGYYTGVIYWFKYEPIKWSILSEENGKVLLLADIALDSQQYNIDNYNGYKTKNGRKVYANDYVESDIRRFINYSFYNRAFNDLQKALIKTFEIQFTGIKINDNVFLLERSDIRQYFDENALRQKKSTDYAKSQGCWTSTDSSYKGNCSWWLRTANLYPGTSNTITVGGIYSTYDVNNTTYGVVPALWISLS